MGYDSAFGRGREGTIEMLRVIASARDVAVRAAAPRLLEGRPVKSSQLRRAIAEGDLAAARAMMGRPPTLVGRVARGDGRGRSLGFPTANLDCRALVLPPAGVYAIRGWARGPGIGIEEHGEGPLPGAMYIGWLPTFGGADLPRVEAHLFDFPAGRNLYGMTMSVELVDRLREDRRFADADSLRAQIAADCRKAREVLQPADGRPMSCGCSPRDAGVE
jgi:riboflavin kinase/FMN adenylyltransferase